MSRVTFDGTGISVFELKRQIITINRLGDGTDFDLAINHQETGEGTWFQCVKVVVDLVLTASKIQSMMMTQQLFRVQLR